MKKLIPLLAAAALIVAGCASDNGGQAKPAAQNNNEKNPEVGWTKDQVMALYGKTDNMRVGSDGETWVYNLNMGEQFIPFNFGYRPKLRLIEFDKDGKVKGWSYSK
jgi:hypothetical protein